MPPKKRVAVIGTGPSGAIAVDALVQERAFDVIRVFERQERAGGNWVSRPNERPEPLDIDALSSRTADTPIPLPPTLPAQTPALETHRYTDSHIYPNLHTNVDASVMEYSVEKISSIKSDWSIGLHGPDTPFRHHEVISGYIEGLLDRNGYGDLVEFNTTVERAVKDAERDEWVLTLRRAGQDGEGDYWWTETFDALVVASGHYHVPYVPPIPGLKEFAERYPGAVEHAKQYRGPGKYEGKRVITIGASVSAADTAVSLATTTSSPPKYPIYAVVRGKYNIYFGDEAFEHPLIERRPPISRIDSANGTRTVHFEDGSSVSDVDHLIFGTGFTWTLPFLQNIEIRNNRVPGLYLHVFHESDDSLVFLGAVGAGLTFKLFEWQAVAAARVLAGKSTLPPLSTRQKWESDRIAARGDAAGFLMVNPDFEEYFEQLHALAGEPGEGEPGRRLPRFESVWAEDFARGHERRIQMWRRGNEEARRSLENGVINGA
ncbi:hypothetical protein BJY04DRAFT_193314 [Aspergillus karnatakaensis]|uniref:uncharacterized protein n=1 Tax=Aspergillus karnatakaensis TaxID=1810916 RepID=UPI003CCE1ACE